MSSIAAIKIAQKEAGLDDPTYRALLHRLTGVTSATMLNPQQRKKVFAEIRKRIHVEKTPAEKKLWALWYDLKKYLPEEEHKVRYLIGFINRLTDREINKVSDLTPAERVKAIEALKLRIVEEKIICNPEQNYKLKN